METRPWYQEVNWRQVSSVADGMFQQACLDGLAAQDDVLARLERIQPTLNSCDSEGLASLVFDPVEITRNQLYNGGHRCTAMLGQGVRFVPGACMRADIGPGIDAEQMYPVVEGPLGFGLRRS